MGNHLYYGDNLKVLGESIKDESVDLIYLDPPFNSNAGYNRLFKSPDGNSSGARIEAFNDTWHWRHWRHWNDSAEAACHDMTAYLTMMAVRLIELYRELKPTGSLYLHCDPTAGDYLKILPDAVFEKENFRNEITWKRTSAHSDAKYKFADVTDTIFLYVKTSIGNIWTNINPLSAHAQERLGYPAQKPVALLERILNASSNPGDVVSDPFCGCGTTVHAAQKPGRQWMGIDVTHPAVDLIEKHLRDAFEGVGFETHGVPQDIEGAREKDTSKQGKPDL